MGGGANASEADIGETACTGVELGRFSLLDVRCQEDVTLDVDHVLAVDEGGTDDLANLVRAALRRAPKKTGEEAHV